MTFLHQLASRRIVLLLLLAFFYQVPSAKDASAVDPASSHDAPHGEKSSNPSQSPTAYVAILRGENFGSDPAALSVRINGAPAPNVLLHNSTALSFRIPNSMVQNPHLLESSFVEIKIGVKEYKKIPLIALRQAFISVNLDDFIDSVQRRRENPHGQHDYPQYDDEDEEDSDDEGDYYDDDDSDGDMREQRDEIELIHDDGYNDQNDHTSSTDTEVQEEPAHYSSHDDNGMQSDAKRTGGEKTQQRETEREAAEYQAQLHEKVTRAEALLAEEKQQRINEALQLLNEAIADDDPRAMTVMGLLLLNGGNRVERDVSLAVDHLEKANRLGYPDAQAVLGFLYASRIGDKVVKKDIGAALLLWTFAAEGGSLYAKMAMGYRYFTGTDVKEDCEKASEYYKQVADMVFEEAKEAVEQQMGRTANSDDDAKAEIRPPTPNAMFASERVRLAEGMQQRVLGEGHEVVQYYRHAAERGDAGAQVLMGNLYYYGANDMPQDVDRARQLFTMAANVGNGDALAHLGFMDLRAGRNKSAVDYLKRAAEKGNRLGNHGMGFVTLYGIGTERDEEQAAKYFHEAVKKRHPEAMFNLGIMYSNGIGVSQSHEDAFNLFRLAAEGGHMQSNYNLGVMWLNGTPPANKECTMATQFLKVVAERGVWNYILSKAFRAYEKGAYADALFRYVFAAHAGIEMAQYNAAFMYEYNMVMNENKFSFAPWQSREADNGIKPTRREDAVEEALELYQMSGAQGYSKSMVRLGDLAFSETKDYVRAASAYEKVTKWNAEAMFNLGWMHARGFGMNPDKHIAKRYFDLAKGMDRDAHLPATIALYSLQYSDTLQACMDKVNSVTSQLQALTAEVWDDTSGLSSSVMGDVLIYAVLFAILQVVLIVRRRRLAASREMEQRLNMNERGQGEVAGVDQREDRRDGIYEMILGHEHED